MTSQPRIVSICIAMFLAFPVQQSSAYFCARFYEDVSTRKPFNFTVSDNMTVGSTIRQFERPDTTRRTMTFQAGDITYINFDQETYRLFVKSSLHSKIDNELKLYGTCVDFIPVLNYEIKLPVTMIVRIIDVNDAPVFSTLPAQVTLTEDTPARSTPYRITVDNSYDKVEAFRDTTIDIVEVKADNETVDNTMFRLDTDGYIHLLESLDYEVGPRRYDITIRAKDKGAPPQSNSSVLTFLVGDVDDMPPVFSHPRGYYADVIGEKPIQRPECFDTEPPVEALDGDVTAKSQITYAIIDGEPGPVSYWSPYFRLNEDTGQLCQHETITRSERTHSGATSRLAFHNFTFTIRATQKDDFNKYDTAKLFVHVRDSNENTPMFDRKLYRVTIPEYPGTVRGDRVVQLKASDMDHGLNSVFRYEMGSSVQDVFRLNTRTGWITVKDEKLLDREKNDKFEFRVRAVETESVDLLEDMARVRVTLLDVNDNQPHFYHNVYNFTIKDNLIPGQPIHPSGMGVQAADVDYRDNGRILYKISGVHRLSGATSLSDLGRFTIHPDEGTLRLAGTLADIRRRRQLPRFRLEVTAADRALEESDRKSSSVEVFVNLEEANEYPPRVIARTSPIIVNESAPLGSIVTILKVEDRDGDEDIYLRYRLVGGDEHGVFDVQKGGIIVLKKKLDREMSQTFKLKVEITDGKHTVTTPVDIHVEDANDNPPHFSRNIYVFNVTEEPEIGHVIGKVSAEDPDHGPGGFIEFSIRGGDGSEAFTINNDGVISVVRSHTLLDREHNEKINLRVLAADKGIPPQQSEVEVVLRLSDVNDNAPEFSSRIYHGTVSEDDASPHPQVVLMDLPINATDYDKDLANRNIRFSLSGDGSDIFQMDPFRADIIVNRVGHIDCESRCEFNLVITATDQGGKGRSSTSKLHIAVKDQNDNYPEFVSPLRFSALTDVLIGTRIGQLRARDRDATQPNNQVIYILREGGYGKFTVDFDSGDLYVADNLEREPVMEDYVLQIEAIDGGRSRLSRKANVTISVPYNHGPVILKNSTDLRVKEDVPVGTVFGRMSATDQDILKGKRQKLTFHTSNAYVPLIVTPGGELKTAAPLDRETQGAYVFKVIVHDNGRPPKSSETEIKVIVEDTNDNAPRFSSAVYSGSIVEDDWIPKPGQKVTMKYNISATDDDLSAVYQNIHFSLKGNGSEMFDIDHRTAEVTVSHKGIGHINREAQENFTMKVVARDSGGSGLSSEADLVIHIVDINDEAPVFRQRGQELTVQNSVRAGHVIGHVSAIDRDSEAPNNKIFYTLENDGLGKFKVDPESGALIALQGLFFQPRQRSYLLRVGAMDLGYPSHKATDTVTVKMLKTKFNDYKPEFHGQTIFYTREEVPVGTIIGKLTTVDKDIEPGEKVTLTITADGKVPFKIDSKTGDIRTTDRLDADHGVMAYTFTVKANDNGVPPQEAEAFIGVILEDINDNPPQFTQSTYHHSVSAIFPPYTTVATPFAYDDVDTHNSVYHYAIRGPDAGLYLYIDRDTGIVRTTDKVSQLNTTQVEYTLVATDVYNHQLTAQAKLVVDIYHSTMNECCCIQPCP